MRVYGLTGGIASGKSTVSRALVERGIPVFDADKAARSVVEPGRPALDEIVAAFGEDILTKDGTLDRAKLGERVFADETLRKRLEEITHPRIREEIGVQVLAAAGEGHEFALVDAALMIETGWYEQFAGVVVVWCSRDQQRARVMARDDYTEDEANARLNAQMPLDDKRDLADFVVDNSGSLDDLIPDQINSLVEWLTVGPTRG